jgi:hypothetical protein
MAFTLNCYPVSYRAKYTQNGGWKEEFLEKPHKTPQEEAQLLGIKLRRFLKTGVLGQAPKGAGGRKSSAACGRLDNIQRCPGIKTIKKQKNMVFA